MSCENYSSRLQQEHDNTSHEKQKRKYCLRQSTTSLVLFICLHFIDILSPNEISHITVAATSINYGISQQPITDVNQLMPKLCQNQSVICEGSFCIPGIRKCVCDLRMPVQFGRFCLRQVDIETKCFATNQCNHTVKDAVCIDINSNAILDIDSSKFKLEQWQQLNDLRQQSKSSISQDIPAKQYQIQMYSTTAEPPSRSMFLIEDNRNNLDSLTFEARDAVIISNVRNSPYEINYTLDLIQQNHTRRRTNNSDRSSLNNLFTPMTGSNFNPTRDTHIDEKIMTTNAFSSEIPSTQRTFENSNTQTDATTTVVDLVTSAHNINDVKFKNIVGFKNDESTTQETTKPTTTLHSDLTSRKKTIIKSPNWPPGVCSCPFGFMFDSMLRKCLALSLSDSHCQNDSDCKQILSTHCSQGTKKCECDEPLVWNQRESSCVRQKVTTTTESSVPRKETGDFVDNLLPPLILAKLLPDYTMMLLIFVISVVVGTLIVLKLTVKCFSSSSSALKSPKTKKKRQGMNSNLPPRSPYATLGKPNHKPSSQLANFTQATRGRILNYDFEQEGAKSDSVSPQPPQSTTMTLGRPTKETRPLSEKIGGTMRASKGHKHQAVNEQSNCKNSAVTKTAKNDETNDQLMELNDNISISQLESESKSDNSVITIPGPPPAQQPPYMLKSAMRGQGSAIAAAAAAVANKRMQLAQKKNLEQQTTSSKMANGSPVFL